MDAFRKLLDPVINFAAGKPIDGALQEDLNKAFPADSTTFIDIENACKEAIKAGWMCAQGDEGRQFGRVIEPSDLTQDFSVDVVFLTDVIGPHHRHPTGEIYMVMPQNEGATFDGNGAGWCTYKAGSAHFPTARDGSVMVLYLLPGGQIEFTGRSAA